MEESIKDFMIKAYPDTELMYFVSNDEYKYYYDEDLDSIKFHYNDFGFNDIHMLAFKSEKEAMDYVKEHKDYLSFFI